MTISYSEAPTSVEARRVQVSIQDIDLETGIAIGVMPDGRNFQIDFKIGRGRVYDIPAQGEVWWIQKKNGVWVLDYLDPVARPDFTTMSQGDTYLQGTPKVLEGALTPWDGGEVPEEILNATKGYAVSVLALGCIPNDTSPAVAELNTTRINSALSTGHAFYPAGNVYFPPGQWSINNSIRMPSSRRVTGAGQNLSEIRMISGAPSNAPCITNLRNTNTEHTTVDSYLYVADLTINGNGGNRNGDPDVNGNGACVRWSTVKYALVERVYAYNGYSHSFDVAASVYQNNAVPLNAPNKRPPGPSSHVVYRDCVAGGSYDDAFTSHDSSYILYERCVAWNHEAKPRTGHSNGFEVDDGSRHVVLKGCHVRGFSTGVAIKGHDPSIPASHVTVIDTSVEWCRYGFWIFWDNWAADPSLPTDVVLRGCSVSGLGDTLEYDAGLGYAYHPAILVSAYSNVHIEDFKMFDSPTSEIAIRNGANRVLLEKIVSEACWTQPYDPYNRGVITVYDGAGDDVQVKNVHIRKHGNSPVSGVQVMTANSCLVEDVKIDSTDSPTWLASTVYGPGASVSVSSSRYITVKGGTSGTVAPSANMGTTVTDGTVLWTRVRSAGVTLNNITDRILARRITAPGFRFVAEARTGVNVGTFTGQPPAPVGWWVTPGGGVIPTPVLEDGSVTLPKLRVETGFNAVTDPGFQNPVVNAQRCQTGITFTSGKLQIPEPNSIRIWIVGESPSSTSGNPTTARGFTPATPGEVWRGSFWVNSTISRPCRLQITYVGIDGTTSTATWALPINPSVPAGVDFQVNRTFTIRQAVSSGARIIGFMAAVVFDGGQTAGQAASIWQPRIFPAPSVVSIADFATSGQMAGTEDATSAFQRAIDYLADLGGGTLTSPPGCRYLFDGSKVVAVEKAHNVTIDMQWSVFFKNSQAGYYVIFQDRNGTVGWGGGVRNFTVENFIVEGLFSDATPASVCLMAGNHSSGVTFRNGEFRQTMLQSSHSFDFAGAENLLFENLVWYGYKHTGTAAPRSEAINIDNSLNGSGAASSGTASGLSCRNVTGRNLKFFPWTDPATSIKWPAPIPIGSHSASEGSPFENVVLENILVVDPPKDDASTAITGDDPYIRGIFHWPAIRGLRIKARVVATDGQGCIRIIQVQSSGSGNLAGTANNPQTGTFTTPMEARDIDIDLDLEGFGGTLSGLNPTVYVGGLTALKTKNVSVKIKSGVVDKEAVFFRCVEGASIEIVNLASSTRGARLIDCNHVTVKGNMKNTQIPVSTDGCQYISVGPLTAFSSTLQSAVVATGTGNRITANGINAKGYSALFSILPSVRAEAGNIVEA